MRRLLALFLMAACTLSCGEADDNVACDNDEDCFANEACVSPREGQQTVCKLKAGEPCIRPSQCEYPLPCYQGFCGGYRPDR